MPVLSKEFLDIQATIECRFTLKRIRDMIIIYSETNGMCTLFISTQIYLVLNTCCSSSDDILLQVFRIWKYFQQQVLKVQRNSFVYTVFLFY